MTQPPGSSSPAWAQAVRYTRDPLGFTVVAQRRYGDVFSVKFPFFGRIFYVASPELAKQVFTGSPAVFHAGEANATVLEPALGPTSVLTLDDEPHMRARKTLLPPFHGDRIRVYSELMLAATRREIERWPVGEPFALRPHMQRITLAVILRAVFGISEEARIDRATALLDRFTARVSPITRFPILRRDLGPGSPWRRFVKARAALDDFLYEEIALRRAEAAKEEGDDVLSLLLAARHEDGSPLTDAELRDELVTVVGAGHETTATALAWTFDLLLRHPAPLARLRTSLEAGEEAYLKATIAESLRLRPVIPLAGRRLAEDLVTDDLELPAGTDVTAAIWLAHTNPDIYPEPFAFRPERFLEAAPETYAWIPYGGGVRRCLGAAFAELEMRIVLREVLGRCELRKASPEPERTGRRNITFSPKDGTPVVLEARAPASADEPELAAA